MNAQAEQTETVFRLPLAQLHRSPTDPRKHDHEPDEEFVNSIREHGVLQPIVVRRVQAGTRKSGPAYEVVFGNRRRRGSELAGLAVVPCIVREMSDDDVLEAQLIENEQRKDPHPLDSADHYALLLERGYTVQRIADKIGFSVRYVQERLQLRNLSPACRKALDDERINFRVALLLARIPHHKLQNEALVDVGANETEAALSSREAATQIQERFMLKLVDAPFDRSSPDLVKKAGACTVCPKRTGNQGELFADVQSDDVCTDPICYREKLDAHSEVELKEAKAKGRKVLSQQEAKGIFSKHAYPPDRVGWNSAWAEFDSTARKTLGKAYEGVALARNPYTGRIFELVPRKSLQAAASAAARAKSKGSNSTRSKASPAELAKREREKLKAQAKKQIAARTLHALVEAVERGFDVETTLRLLLKPLLWNCGELDVVLDHRIGTERKRMSPNDEHAAIAAHTLDFDAAQLLGLVFEICFADTVDYQDQRTAFRVSEACKTLGVDQKKIEAAVLAELKAEREKTATRAREQKKQAKIDQNAEERAFEATAKPGKRKPAKAKAAKRKPRKA